MLSSLSIFEIEIESIQFFSSWSKSLSTELKVTKLLKCSLWHSFELCYQEEYINLNTLERRLTCLMQRFQRNRNQNVSHRDPHVGTMILTPELQQSGNASAMIPAPGTDISTVNGHGTSNMVPNTVGMWNMLPNSNLNVGMWNTDLNTLIVLRDAFYNWVLITELCY